MQKRKKWKMIGRYCLLTLLAALTLTGCASLFASSLIHANRQPIIKTPRDYGLDYEKVEFQSPDGITLRGWYIPGERDTIAIMTHPMNFTKYGYSTKNQGRFKITDIEVEFLPTARQLHQAGHSVLTFDFRNHGESDDSPDKIFGLGNFEWQDIAGCLDWIHNQPEHKDKQLFFVSFCTGANSTIIAMSKAREKFNNVKCIVAVQPISMEVFVDNFMQAKYHSLTWLIPGIKRKFVEKGGLPFAEMSPLNYVQNIFLPILYVQVETDPWTDPDYVLQMYLATPQPKNIRWIVAAEGDEEMQRFDMYNYFGQRPEILLDYIDRWVDG